jgi:hypothetical protein
MSKETFPCWTLAGTTNYWHRPLRPDEDPKGLRQGEINVINAACGSDFSYTRIYTQFGSVYALTLALAASFDADGTAGNRDL